MSSRLLFAASTAGFLGLLLSGSAGAAAPAPYPCGVVPTADIVAALGSKLGELVPAQSSVGAVSTCTYGRDALSLSVGATTIANPMLPLKVVSVPGLPNGTYRTFKGSAQTEIIFVKGSAATGIYGVVRSFVKVKQAKLEAIAIALDAGIGTGQSGNASTSPTLLNG